VLLLIGAGLFVRSFNAIRALDVGLDLDRVIEATLPARTPLAADAQALYGPALERLVSLPGVERAAMTYRSSPVSIRLDGALQQTGVRTAPTLTVVTPDYFATLGATLESGRKLTLDDEHRGERVAVINRALAGEYWPGADPVGQCLQLGSDDQCTQVVGIVENILLNNRTDTEQGQLYVLSSHPFGAGRPTRVVVRVSREAGPLVPAVRQVIQSLAPDMPFVRVETVQARTAPQLRPWRLGSTMFLAFGAVALLIAALGVYSSLAHAVSQRTHEIGVRMALGASTWHVISVIGAHAVATIGSGVVLGLLLAAMATDWLRDLLYQTSPRDPVVFAAVAAVLIMTGITAAILPAYRSTRVSPLVALKVTD
jgi:predicted permease